MQNHTPVYQDQKPQIAQFDYDFNTSYLLRLAQSHEDTQPRKDEDLPVHPGQTSQNLLPFLHHENIVPSFLRQVPLNAPFADVFGSPRSPYVPSESLAYDEEGLCPIEASETASSSSVSMGAECPQPVVNNIVCCFGVGVKLDLRTIQRKARNCEYNPKRFPALVMRIKKPSTTANIFASGKIMLMGAKTERESLLGAKKYVKILKNLGFQARLSNYRIVNIVCGYDFKFRIPLLELEQRLVGSRYDPELFSGVIWRLKEPKVVFLIYKSGKVLMAGARDRETLNQAFAKLHPLLTQLHQEEQN